ncbi:YwbE family protein [Paenibacillus pasadenensis]|uniref:YwbE family protein n=1 Tax=Paenibacillus pasadenensis TaxID=217090 RepID=UPI00203CD00D|nr:YwbE family protein [Paenibacillus pasadenensis]MCM3747164.1 YwbE family protein [Paenibacillus pasadenensis]
MTVSQRSSLWSGMTVDIVLKQDQRTGKLTRGIIKDILTKSPSHPHGIKVRLEDGQVGRVKAIVEYTGGL